MPDTTPMRERLISALKRVTEEPNAYCLFDYSPYEGVGAPHVVKDRFDVEVYRSNDREEAFLKYDELMAWHVIDAILSELEKPTPEMVKIGAAALLTAEGYDVEKLDHYDYPPVVEETEAEFLAGFAAAICAAKETK